MLTFKNFYGRNVISDSLTSVELKLNDHVTKAFGTKETAKRGVVNFQSLALETYPGGKIQIDFITPMRALFKSFNGANLASQTTSLMFMRAGCPNGYELSNELLSCSIYGVGKYGTIAFPSCPRLIWRCERIWRIA